MNDPLSVIAPAVAVTLSGPLVLVRTERATFVPAVYVIAPVELVVVVPSVIVIEPPVAVTPIVPVPPVVMLAPWATLFAAVRAIAPVPERTLAPALSVRFEPGPPAVTVTVPVPLALNAALSAEFRVIEPPTVTSWMLPLAVVLRSCWLATAVLVVVASALTLAREKATAFTATVPFTCT